MVVAVFFTPLQFPNTGNLNKIFQGTVDPKLIKKIKSESDLGDSLFATANSLHTSLDAISRVLSIAEKGLQLIHGANSLTNTSKGHLLIY